MVERGVHDLAAFISQALEDLVSGRLAHEKEE
jgi:hypothetical protein